jgi:hypothetical protein
VGWFDEISADTPVVFIAFSGGMHRRQLNAQTVTSGAVTGAVADASGAVVIKATVTLKSSEKGFSQAATTIGGISKLHEINELLENKSTPPQPVGR